MNLVAISGQKLRNPLKDNLIRLLIMSNVNDDKYATNWAGQIYTDQGCRLTDSSSISIPSTGLPSDWPQIKDILYGFLAKSQVHISPSKRGDKRRI